MRSGTPIPCSVTSGDWEAPAQWVRGVGGTRGRGRGRGHLLLLIRFPLLLHDDDQVLLALFLELSHLFLGILQLQRHHFHLFPSFIDLRQPRPQLIGLVQQLLPLLCQQPRGQSRIGASGAGAPRKERPI